MPLTPGTTLGRYAVTAKIGEGGLGEVYRARDTKLDRDVALKVLPQAFTDDPDRLARFEREAKVLSPFVIPDREAVIFVISSGAPLAYGQLAVLDLNTSEVTRPGLAGFSPYYVSTGHPLEPWNRVGV